MSSENVNLESNLESRVKCVDCLFQPKQKYNSWVHLFVIVGGSRPSGGPASWTLWFKGRWVSASPAFLREREEIWLAGKKPKFFIGAFTLYVLTVNQTNLF